MLEQKTVTMTTVLRLLIIVRASRKVCRVIGRRWLVIVSIVSVKVTLAVTGTF